MADTQDADQPAGPATDVSGLELLDRPIYVLDPDRVEIVWANSAALQLWRAPSLAALRDRNHAADLSRSAKIRLNRYREALARGERLEEPWTLYPLGQAVTVQCRMRPIALTDDRWALLVEATPLEQRVPADFVRGLEALRHCEEAISLYATDGRCLMRNPAALAIYGGEDHRFDHRFPDETTRNRVAAELTACGVFEGEVPVITDRGEGRHTLTVRSTRDPVTGEPAYLVCERDITQWRATQAALSEAEAASDAKSAFLSTVSHELRTPLNAIIGFAQILENASFGPHSDARYAEYAGDILSSARHLRAVIEDVLDMARAEADRLSLEEETVRPEKLARDCVRLLAPEAETQGVTLARDHDNELTPITVDPVKMRQVLINLLGNAVKASPAGGQVTVHLYQNGGGRTALAVADGGPGVAEEDVPRILAPFGQADGNVPQIAQAGEAEHGVRAGAGLGLGLPLAKAIVEAHGGRLIFDSEPGAGTRVTAELPPERLAVASTRNA